MPGIFKKQPREIPPYLERIDELEKVSIVRLKGRITHTMIPVIELRVQANRRAGSKIDKNVLLDFAKVDDVDSSTIAFHIIQLEEYHQQGFEVGFININEEFKNLLDVFQENGKFKVFITEAEAVQVLNR